MQLESYLYRMNEALAEDQRDDVQGYVTNLGVHMDERLQDLLQIHLNYCARHPEKKQHQLMRETPASVCLFRKFW